MKTTFTHKFRTEADLCAAFLSCIPEGWTAYNETGDFDILLVHDETGHQIGIEAKLTLNAKVLCQATDRRDNRYAHDGPDYRAVLVGSVSHDMRVIAERLCLTVVTLEAKMVGPKRGYFFQGPPRLTFSLPYGCDLPRFIDYDPTARAWVDRDQWTDCAPIRRLALPEYVPDVAAGHPAPQKLSAWKIAAIRACVFCEKQGYLDRSHFKALRLSPSRWLDGLTMKKATVRGRWVPARYWPAESYRAQHPTVFAQIEADMATWMKDAGLSVSDTTTGLPV